MNNRKIYILEDNKNNVFLDLSLIKKYLNISNESTKDDNFIIELYSSIINYVENLLYICLGEKKYKIQYDFYLNQACINLIYNPVIEIESIFFLTSDNKEIEIKDFNFLPDNQSIIFKNQELFFDDNIFINPFQRKYSVFVVQKSKFNNFEKNYDLMKSKILQHINILYKNRNFFSFDNKNLAEYNSSIKNIYSDLIINLLN
jgi:hypothetical protein